MVAMSCVDICVGLFVPTVDRLPEVVDSSVKLNVTC